MTRLFVYLKRIASKFRLPWLKVHWKKRHPEKYMWYEEQITSLLICVMSTVQIPTLTPPVSYAEVCYSIGIVLWNDITGNNG